MSLYETVFIVRPDVPAPEVIKLADKFADLIKQNGGELVKQEYWKLRKLQYQIGKSTKGHYMMLGVSAPTSAIKELERNYKINEDVIKHMVFRVEEISKDPSPMMQTSSDINDAVGE